MVLCFLMYLSLCLFVRVVVPPFVTFFLFLSNCIIIISNNYSSTNLEYKHIPPNMILPSTTPYYYYALVLCALFCPLPYHQVTAFAPSGPASSNTVHNHRYGATTTTLRMAEGSAISGPPYSGPSVKPILDSVTYPSDMKRLDMRQLKQVRGSNSSHLD